MIFIEIDHNYVNPVNEEYLASVNDAFSDLGAWNQQNRYRSAELTFNEYLTWGLADIYLFENSVSDAYEKYKDLTNRTMIESRRFIKYNIFSKKILELYLEQGDEKSTPDLYPLIIEWAISTQNQD